MGGGGGGGGGDLLINRTDEFQSVKRCVVITLSPELVP